MIRRERERIYLYDKSTKKKPHISSRYTIWETQLWNLPICVINQIILSIHIKSLSTICKLLWLPAKRSNQILIHIQWNLSLQGTLWWEDTLWSGDILSKQCPICPMLRNLWWRDTCRVGTLSAGDNMNRDHWTQLSMCSKSDLCAPQCFVCWHICYSTLMSN